MSELYHETENADLLEDIVKPPIYAKNAIWGVSFFFTPLFGGILLMQNLKDIGKKKQANIVLLISILITVLVISLVAVFDVKNRSITLLCNIAGAAILTEFFYKKYFPDDKDYEKKKIWKPLIIGIVICVVLVLIQVLAQESLPH